MNTHTHTHTPTHTHAHAHAHRVVQQSLFPDNTYRHDSGGDPQVIPDLTFEQFQVGLVRISNSDCMH